jgi:ubiquinone/menaquinone biosynthesis C-methylase UbiE
MIKLNALNKKQQLFDRWAPNYDWVFTSVFYQAIHQRLLEYVDLQDLPNVLDIGCGTGRLLTRLATEFPNLQGTGLDFSAEMIRQARRRKPDRVRPRLIYLQGNAESLPFVGEQFDAVFNTISFLHYPKPEQVFSEVSRVLVTGGRFYLVDYAFRWPTTTQFLNISPGGMRFYSPQVREQLGVQAGLGCAGHYNLLGPVLLSIFTKKPV